MEKWTNMEKWKSGKPDGLPVTQSGLGLRKAGQQYTAGRRCPSPCTMLTGLTRFKNLLDYYIFCGLIIMFANYKKYYINFSFIYKLVL